MSNNESIIRKWTRNNLIISANCLSHYQPFYASDWSLTDLQSWGLLPSNRLHVADDCRTDEAVMIHDSLWLCIRSTGFPRELPTAPQAVEITACYSSPWQTPTLPNEAEHPCCNCHLFWVSHEGATLKQAKAFFGFCGRLQTALCVHVPLTIDDVVFFV